MTFKAVSCLALLLCGCNLPPPTAEDFNQIGQRSGPSSMDQVLQRQHENTLRNEQIREHQQILDRIDRSKGSWIYNSYTRQSQYVPPGASYHWDNNQKTWIIQP